MTRTRAHTAALHTMPPGGHLPTLRVWAEWRRQGLSVRELARRTTYHVETVRRFLRGEPVMWRDGMARDLARALRVRL